MLARPSEVVRWKIRKTVIASRGPPAKVGGVEPESVPVWCEGGEEPPGRGGGMEERLDGGRKRR